VVKPPDRFPLAEHAEHRLDRRRFLGAAAGAALVVAAGEWLGHAYASAAAARPDVALPDGGLLARGESRALAASHGREVLMVRLADDALVAFDRRCPHLGCPVLWSAERVRFECPCHHAAFDARTGRVLFGPPRRGLTPAPSGRNT
jgi:Rieske Fe-S protein